jgi:hypothetical protein
VCQHNVSLLGADAQCPGSDAFNVGAKLANLEQSGVCIIELLAYRACREGATLSGRLCAYKILEAAPDLAPANAQAAVNAA